MTRILIIRFSALGDIILTFPALNALCNMQDYEVHFLTKQSFAPLLQMHAGIHSIHVVSDHASIKELLLKIYELKKFNFYAVYDLHRNLRSRIVSGLLWKKTYRIKKPRLKEWFLFSFRRRIFKLLNVKPIDRQSAIFDQMMRGSLSHKPVEDSFSGEKVKNFLKVASIPEGALRDLAHFKGNFICICAESAWKQKEWPLKRFTSVAQSLVNAGIGVVWIGLNPLDQTNMPKGSLDLIGKLTIQEVAALLSQAKLLVSNDSGLMHLSELVGTPVVAVFGPTSSELGFAPKLRSSQIVESDLWCRPCSKSGRYCFRPIQRMKCLSAVTVDQVVQAVFKAV